jgi:hypothetical protein
MLLLKACPHCRGDLSFERDRRCAYLECVQCGHILSLEQEKALGVRSSRHGLIHRELPLPMQNVVAAAPQVSPVSPHACTS